MSEQNWLPTAHDVFQGCIWLSIAVGGWWARGINNKVDVLIENLAKSSIETSQQNEDLEKVENDVEEISNKVSNNHLSTRDGLHKLREDMITGFVTKKEFIAEIRDIKNSVAQVSVAIQAGIQQIDASIHRRFEDLGLTKK